MKYRKIAIIGISGTGKSTLGLRLAEKTGFPLYHLDSIIWSPGWTETDSQKLRQEYLKIEGLDEWIIEGWVDDHTQDLLKTADVIVDLDYPGYLAAWGEFKRSCRYMGKKRPEMPEGCITYLKMSFLAQIFFRKERPSIERILSALPGVRIIPLKSRKQAEKALRELAET